MKVKEIIKKLITGILTISLLNIGMVVLAEEPAMAANCSLYSTTDMFGNTSTTGTCGGSRVSTYSRTDMFGNTSTRGSVNCFWNC
tara:strand:- start:315 stop:569 length:255 start_codon:yes stop_codon:yes gene_type:complete